MPAQQRLRLDDEERGLPAAHKARQQHKQDAIAGRDCGTLDLAPQHDQLLPEERVLGHQRGLGHGHVSDRPAHGRPRRGLGPPQQPAMDGVKVGHRALFHQATDCSHHVMPPSQARLS